MVIRAAFTEDLKAREEKTQRVQNDLRHLLESLAILVSTPNRFVESHENAIKDRIREILADNKDQSLVAHRALWHRHSETETTYVQFLFEKKILELKINFFKCKSFSLLWNSHLINGL